MNCDIYRFDEVTISYDRKRIPLSSRERSKKNGTYRYYGAQGVIDHIDSYIFDGTYLLIAEDGENLKSNRQNIAQIASGKFWVNNHAHVIKTNELCNLRFLYYLINSMDLSAYVTGSVQPKLSQTSLNAVMLRIPPLDVQEKIAAILSSLDDKIDLNRRINENLERQSMAIFRHEFLSFNVMPEGWRKGSLIEIADYLNGLPMQKYRPENEYSSLPVLKIKELRQGFCGSDSDLCSSSISPEYIIHDGDVIFSWSGSLLVDFWCGGLCGLNQHLFKVTSGKYDKWFYYSWTKYYLSKFAKIAADMATTMGHIKRGELAKTEVLIPPESDYKSIGAILSPIYEQIISNRLQNKKLAQIRDALLPKLISGEITP